ncbi:hypothetical protein [Wocania ichthyoenteri]|uniref:hypothetical protein n=1 Tax=Wocania ichthyoenteri TaxID=1230531 RepID=UPI00053E8BB8|nr:hypothetical protein [Wocania ichthyoenteri]
MNLENYPELKAIQKLISKNNISFRKHSRITFYENIFPIELKIRDDLFTIYIDDEYNDLEKNNYILNFILVFRALADLDESTDYLNWCKKLW